MDENAIDDYVKEDCACGHRRYSHANGPCSRTRVVTDFAALPAPERDDPDNAFEYPRNWPPALLLPRTEERCPCTGFHYPEPEPAFLEGAY